MQIAVISNKARREVFEAGLARLAEVDFLDYQTIRFKDTLTRLAFEGYYACVIDLMELNHPAGALRELMEWRALDKRMNMKIMLLTATDFSDLERPLRKKVKRLTRLGIECVVGRYEDISAPEAVSIEEAEKTRPPEPAGATAGRRDEQLGARADKTPQASPEPPETRKLLETAATEANQAIRRPGKPVTVKGVDLTIGQTENRNALQVEKTAPPTPLDITPPDDLLEPPLDFERPLKVKAAPVDVPVRIKAQTLEDTGTPSSKPLVIEKAKPPAPLDITPESKPQIRTEDSERPLTVKASRSLQAADDPDNAYSKAIDIADVANVAKQQTSQSYKYNNATSAISALPEVLRTPVADGRQFVIYLPPEYVQPTSGPTKAERFWFQVQSSLRTVAAFVVATIALSLIAYLFINSDLGKEAIQWLKNLGL
jgi:hypothetical protein